MKIGIFVPDVYRTYKIRLGCVGDNAGTCLERLVGVSFIVNEIINSILYVHMQISNFIT